MDREAMTDQEQQLINGLIGRVNSTQLTSKDPEAANLIQDTLGRNPDAMYILAQTVIVQQFALDNTGKQLAAAKAELEQLKQQVQPQTEERHGSFLGNLFGLGHDAPLPAPPAYNNPTGYKPVHNPAPPPTQYGGYPQQPGYPQGGYPSPPPPVGYGQPYGYGAPMGGGVFGGGGGGFLSGAMQTAAGVVAGEMAFRAIEDVFHMGGGGREFGGGEVVNNYYDDRPADSGSGGFGDRLAQADGADGSISPDIEDRRGESRGFFGGGDGGDQSAVADDGGDDQSNFADDSGSFDDNSGGGDDNSSGGDNGF